MDKRTHASRAKSLLDAGDDTDLPYVALELRMAMEAIVYEKLRLYAPRLPADVLGTWQPPQAMRALLEFEPQAAANKRMRIAREDADGQPQEWHEMGEHRSFKLAWLRKSYNKVGSLLHIPSPKNETRAAAPTTVAPTRADLAAILAEVERVAASRMDSSVASVITFKCGVCDSPVLRNEAGARQTNRATCLAPNCAAEHVAHFAADGSVAFHLIATDFDCLSCKALIRVENRKLAIGLRFRCTSCKAEHTIAETQWGYGLAAELSPPGA